MTKTPFFREISCRSGPLVAEPWAIYVPAASRTSVPGTRSWELFPMFPPSARNAFVGKTVLNGARLA